MTSVQHRSILAWVILVLTWQGTSAPARAQAVSGPPTTKPVLFLSDGGYLTGTLCDSARPGALLWPDVLFWKNDSFSLPFEIPSTRLYAVRWPTPKVIPKPAGDFSFETTGGDLLFGSLVRLTDKEVELDLPPHGRVRLERSRLKRFASLRAGGEQVYVGPNGLGEWKSPSTNGWREEGGDLVSDVPGSSIHADLGMPGRAAVEIEISWSKKPSFIIALGTGFDQESIRESFHLEVIDDKLVALIETKTDADIEPIQQVEDKPGRAHLIVLLDSTAGRFLVTTPEGRKLADLQVDPRPGKQSASVFLANALGNLRLERLRISAWDGSIPNEADAGSVRISRIDRTVLSGGALTYDPGAKELVVSTTAGATRVKLDEVSAVRLNPSKVEDKRPAIRLTAVDGTRVSGTLLKVAQSVIWIAVPGFAEPIGMSVHSLRTLNSLNQEVVSHADSGAIGLLELDEVRLKGSLTSGAGNADASCLVWRPLASVSPSPLRPGISGRIIYHEQKAPDGTVPQPSQATTIRRMAILRRGQIPPPNEPPAIVERGKRMLYLRSGDTVVADITKIDEEGVWFKSPASEKTFVAHEKLKAVELGPDVSRTIVLNRSKYDRLLTLPRMQKDSPPTQLLRSTNGDYLRGRVVAMDDKKLSFEVRLETREIPRERVARITWLHNDELDPAKLPPAPPAAPGQTRVQAVRTNGLRLTFFAERFADGTLFGQSDVFGACNVRCDEIDQLLIGSAIEQSAAKLAPQQWKLHNAPDPKYVQGGDAPDAGTESDLVGKPAPDFTLNLLGEGNRPFHLADAKGSIVILDFWATWCGPCLQAMPQVERVADEFKDRGVKLIAVNLQEAPEQISALLKRQNLHPTVALDRDGVVAGKYKAVAIPQTVVIDRDGKVARLFVGSSPDLHDRLREAVDSLLTGKKPESSPADQNKKPPG